MQRQRVGSGTLVAVNIQEAQVAASYHALLQSDPDLARRTHEAVMRDQEDGGLFIAGRPICNVLRPRFMTNSRRTELARVSEILANLFERAGALLLSSDRLLDLVGATDQERWIWETDPGYPGFTVTSRLDSFMVGEHPRFVEYNAESPASIGFCDVLTEIFVRAPAIRAWRLDPGFGTFETRHALYDTLTWAYQSWGAKGTPAIAVVDWDSVLTRRDWELCAAYFRSQGAPTHIADPRAFAYRDGKLWLGDELITLVYRRVLLHELLERAEEAQPLLQAYRDGAVCMVNSPRSKLLHKKAVFALLSDRRLGLELSGEEQEAVDSTIPWTRLLEPGKTDFGGRQVDLAQLLLGDQERFTLKPVDDYGGKGVVLGWDASPEEWERALEEAMGRPFVVQERVVVPRGEFPVWQEDRVELVPLYVDTDPLLFRGKTGGILTRISGHALLNVSAGTGSTTPTFVVEG